ncbi:hypothetical protein H0H87_011585 [Tephrocybe sp. NHM501043]|nr:hypothetical protein H0H87_011585 [Tephrocybe sp. NHM501043]
MTPVERHAELLYAESLFLKALLGIVYSGDWLAFIKEALNMRTTIGVYRSLGAYLDAADAAYRSSKGNAKGPGEDPSIDAHFRSGVYLGVGLCNIILSLIPGKLATLVELFGYKGDRKAGLEMLMRAGGWADAVSPAGPAVTSNEEGVRRSICDMALLVFHLVLSTITVEGVDIGVAGRIVDWNLKRFPNGVFFLFGAGRLALQRSQPRLAIQHYTRAMHSQIQYRNLDHISFWEVAIARLSLWEVGDVVLGEGKAPAEPNGEAKEKTELENGHAEAGEGKGAEGWEKVDKAEGEETIGGSAACWRVLVEEATWSKSIYTYGLAACLLEDWDSDSAAVGGPSTAKAARAKEAAELMKKVPELRQKIAGKSIPLEKLFARKARKFTSQHARLLLPALEVAYIFQAIAHAPASSISSKMLPLVRGALAKLSLYGDGTGLDAGKEGKKGIEHYEGGKHEYWDDLCLARFLEGVCERFVAYPDPDAIPDCDADAHPAAGEADGAEGKQERAEKAEKAFRAVLEYGPRIELDHWLVYHARASRLPDSFSAFALSFLFPFTNPSFSTFYIFKSIPKQGTDTPCTDYELGRLLACRGDVAAARREFELVLSGKHLEVGASGRRGKYSMEVRYVCFLPSIFGEGSWAHIEHASLEDTRGA